jgi:diaminopropionate ammonia-lyase
MLTQDNRGTSISLFSNPCTEEGGRFRSTLCNLVAIEKARELLSRWPGYQATPVISLDCLARTLGVERIWLKDESSRFGIGNFKALGAAHAMISIDKEFHVDRTKQRKQVTICCATDGNYGKAISWAANHFGYKCIVYLPEQVSRHREGAILRLGAKTVRISGNYDKSVIEVGLASRKYGWTLVSDTSHTNDTAIPKSVMSGYAVMLHELAEQIELHEVTHVFLQCGVGSFAGAVTAYLIHRLRGKMPTIVTVEPQSAACIFASGAHGRMVTIRGALGTIMGGLACGRPSPLAWQVLRRRADFFSKISDATALQAVRSLASGEAATEAVLMGETGAAGVAALSSIGSSSELKDQIGLDGRSHVLLFGTEGPTDLEICRESLSQ